MILGIVTSRLGSTRLPAKALLPIAGRTMVEHVLHEMLKSDVDRTVLCTPDKFLADYIFLDSLIWDGDRDMTGELRAAADKYNATHIVRVTADCPFVTSNIINKVITEHMESCSEYTYNHHDNLPSMTKEGIDVEVVSREGLEKLRGKEHLYNGENVKTHNVYTEEERDVFSVDTLEDYIRAFKEF